MGCADSNLFIIEIFVHIVLVFEYFLFRLFLRREKLSRVIQIRQDFLVEIEVLVPDVGERSFQGGFLAPGLDLPPAPVPTGTQRTGALSDSAPHDAGRNRIRGGLRLRNVGR